MINVDERSFEDVFTDLRIAQARRAIRQLQDLSVRTGLDHMTLEDINAEISAARSERASGETD